MADAKRGRGRPARTDNPERVNFYLSARARAVLDLISRNEGLSGASESIEALTKLPTAKRRAMIDTSDVSALTASERSIYGLLRMLAKRNESLSATSVADHFSVKWKEVVYELEVLYQAGLIDRSDDSPDARYWSKSAAE